MDINILWEKTLELLEKSMTQVVFDSMIASCSPVSYVNDTFTVMTRNEFFKPALQQRYFHEITRCARNVAQNDNLEMRIISEEDLVNYQNSSSTFADYEKTNLRPKYIFDTYVRGKCNDLAYNAACAVAENPGTSETYNPLFLYGGVGLGKTHLIHAIGNQCLETHPDKKIMYISSEAFTNEFIAAIREQTTMQFKNKYRNVDVILIDDVQFLVGKTETQEELFHTFNDLYNANKQIVLTSDMPPKDLIGLEERLKSRFAFGLTADITLPDYETRTAILEKKLRSEEMDIPQEVKDFITRNIVSNIRDLEGALNKVIAYAHLTRATITLELAQAALKDQLVNAQKPEITMDYIQKVVADHFKVTQEDLNSRKRTQSIVYPRQIAMYLCRKIMDKSLPDVGKFFGGRDHSTVIHSCEKIAHELEQEEKLRILLDELEIRIRGE